MAFSFDPTLPAALDRVRLALGDIASPGLLANETYSAILTTHTSGDPAVVDEAAAIRDMAKFLAAFYATKPTQVKIDELNITWGERVAQWNRIALGQAGGAQARTATGLTITRGAARDYTTGEGDATP